MVSTTANSFKTVSLESSHNGNGGQKVHFKDKGGDEELPIAWVQLQDHLAVPSSWWPPPTPTLIHSTAGHPLLEVPSAHPLGKGALNHTSHRLSSYYLHGSPLSILYIFGLWRSITLILKALLNPRAPLFMILLLHGTQPGPYWWAQKYQSYKCYSLLSPISLSIRFKEYWISCPDANFL